MTKATSKKTARTAATNSAAPKRTSVKPAKTSAAAKKKPAIRKAAAEKAVLPNTSDEKATNTKATTKVAAKKTTTKKVATRKTAAASKKTAAKKTASKPVAKKTSAAAATKKVAKKTASKKNPAQRAERLPIAPATLDSDYDENDPDMDLPPSSQSTVVPYERGSSGHYMDDDQLGHFSKKLAEWKQQLMEEVDRTVGHMKDDATNFPDPNDRATQEEEFSLELRTRDRERKLIKKINEAQKRIDDDEYGYCETCGIEIGVNRLEARPTAELCIDCKTLEEIRERQTA